MESSLKDKIEDGGSLLNQDNAGSFSVIVTPQKYSRIFIIKNINIFRV